MPPDATMSPEEWRPVLSYVGYEASSLGRVRRPKTGHIVTARANKKNGRLYVNLRDPVRQHPYSAQVSKLVAEAFLGARPQGLEINHKDCDPHNNRPENLEYVTPQQNIRHAMANGRFGMGERHCNAKLTVAAVIEIRARRGTVLQKVLAEQFGVKPETISAVQRFANWKQVT